MLGKDSTTLLKRWVAFILQIVPLSMVILLLTCMRCADNIALYLNFINKGGMLCQNIGDKLRKM